MIDLSSLNENQLEAVTWNKGPILVLAGPGSGKTRVLTMRIAKILDESPGQHFRLIALTFTNKAASEMRSRVSELIPNEFHRVRLTTFHSFAAELLQQYGDKVGLKPDFQILNNDIDRETLLDSVILQLKKNPSYSIPNHFNGARILPVINRLLELCISANAVKDFLISRNIENAIPLSIVYKEYRSSMRSSNVLDFPSLISETIELLENYPMVIKFLRKVYKHILVDEFQDTNESQYRFLTLLVSFDKSTLFVVADDDQIIYQWNGANPKRINELQDEFHVAQIQLPENYRCPAPIVQSANLLIENNLNRFAGKKPLKAIKTGANNDIIRVFRFNSFDEETKWVATDIANRSADEHNNCAVLARTKKMVENISYELKNLGLSVYQSIRKDEFVSAPMRVLLSILRLANSNNDKDSLARLSKAFFEVEGINLDLMQILSKSSANDKPIFRVWLDDILSTDTLSKESRRLIGTDINPLLNSLNFKLFLNNFFIWADIMWSNHDVEENKFNEYIEERSVWNQLLSEINRKFEGEDISLYHLLHEIDLSSKSPLRKPNDVSCFTIHSSKGMEFKHVYLIGMVEEQLPSWAAIKKGDESLEMQEERRNCFVAITRAQDSLTLTFSDKVYGYNKKPSRFLGEMGVDIN